MNNESYEPSEYGDKAIKRESIITKQYVPDIQPTWYWQFIQSNQLNDDTDFFRISSPDEKPFFNNEKDPTVHASTWTHFPTKDNPTARYKFLSVYFGRSNSFR